MSLTTFIVLLALILSVSIAHEETSVDHDIRQALSTLHKVRSEKISCDLCELGATLLDGYLARNASIDEVIKGATDICITLKIELPDVCVGIMNAYAGIVYSVLILSNIKPIELCDKLKYCSAQDTAANNVQNGLFTSELDQIYGMASLVQNSRRKTDYSKQQPKLSTPFTGTGYILQLTDIHFDPQYLEGSDPNCGKPLCCRNGTGDAGYFGHYLCDIPLRTVKLIFDGILNVSKTMPISFVAWTGDNPPHDVWMQSESKQISATQVLAELVNTYFPSTPVFPSLGNHEAWPADQFILPKQQWLLDSLYENWAPFLGADELSSVKKAGYYTLLLQNGLRIISLNTQDADMINFYNLLQESNMNIPNNQTDWFIDVLEQAESNQEKVIILGHIPCTLKSASNDQWCSIYRSIVERFSGIISAQFYGHTHYDQLVVFSDTATSSKPTGMNYVAPSMTTYQNHEPGFRLYEYDFDNLQVTNYFQFHTNLSKANADGTLEFTLAYSAKELFSMSDLSNESWWTVANQFKTNMTQFNNYYQHIANSPIVKPCDETCHMKWACEGIIVLGFVSDEYHKVMSLDEVNTI
ncbi:sphingomyelinase [Heterostelium album PN500]|uniref:Sphingomyelin phosphodiesterase n=1 Tax=Heterostelium pallidum (strain ATCC 26659 / Pp 5 / PN500) TaxID=670386 RepID=D3BLI6_HETP5|nr:sphingomyelinase [Heterostelium album PN500]EFA77437.1 sphingomyelinase [Heterostelium album PN500]|eukprot:XP_020429565.1 sphingomyelinase [Heterostelium album PN500]